MKQFIFTVGILVNAVIAIMVVTRIFPELNGAGSFGLIIIITVVISGIEWGIYHLASPKPKVFFVELPAGGPNDPMQQILLLVLGDKKKGIVSCPFENHYNEWFPDRIDEIEQRMEQEDVKPKKVPSKEFISVFESEELETGKVESLIESLKK